MQSVGDVYCYQCAAWRQGSVAVGYPAIIALVCDTCSTCLAVSHPDFSVSYADLPAYARMHMVNTMSHDEASEVYRIACFNKG